ncbi:uncharacterized protein LOC110844706 [Folsomia candida]|uniref:uncharacterized protein LOC110844706 n=1 Tax=Folsomia candida TaxID=158441 RepID=UPI000B8FAFBE|nr:uncharacterized protein LOC110844706 [Folsomia candida]
MFVNSLVNTLVRGEINTEKGKDWKFDGVPHKFSFSVEKGIYLVGVDLLGLPLDSKKEKEATTVYLSVVESDILRRRRWGRPMTLMPLKVFNVVLEKDKLTRIHLPFPVRIQPEVWVDLGVQIEGTKTAIMKAKGGDQILGDDKMVVFHTLFSRNTLQMPQIHYLLA